MRVREVKGISSTVQMLDSDHELYILEFQVGTEKVGIPLSLHCEQKPSEEWVRKSEGWLDCLVHLANKGLEVVAPSQNPFYKIRS